MVLTLHSPYLDKHALWIKGNLHAHTTISDGERDPQAVIDDYAARGYHFLMLSDHDLWHDLDRLEARGMTLLSGAEITANGPHLLLVNVGAPVQPLLDRQPVIHKANAAGGLVIVNHPNWDVDFNHCPQERLEQWTGYIGIEVFNGIARRHFGNPYAADRWDRLLSAGRRVWGFAHDDSHAWYDVGMAWNMVQMQTDSHRVEEIVKALREGRFYATTGVTITAVRTVGLSVTVETIDAQRIAAYSRHAARVAVVDGACMSLNVPPDADWGYLRFECYGHGDTIAWTQPIWLHHAP